ncbi:MAG: PilZ domain-containing protein [Desulfobacteraceae bacterium]|nr:PilZ domain-containing protein [Desulfobacteraceae bacterium]
MTDNDNKERRQSKRVDFNTEIYLKTPSQTFRLEGNSRDISQKGVYILTDKDLDIDIDTVCEIKIVLSGASPAVVLNIVGKIARKTSDGLGVEFKEMDLDSYTHLKNIVKFNSKEDDS